LVQIKVPPPPLPPSWGRAVRPYGAPLHWQGADAAAGAQAAAGASAGCSGGGPNAAAAYQCTPDICAFDFGLLARHEFLGVMINTGWEAAAQGPAAAAAPTAAAPAVAAAAQAGPGTAPNQADSADAAAAGPGAGGSASGPAAARAALTRRLSALPVPQLCPRGFLFIWARKQLLAGDGLLWAMFEPCCRLAQLV
jgi:hypothetical protein